MNCVIFSIRVLREIHLCLGCHYKIESRVRNTRQELEQISVARMGHSGHYFKGEA